MKTGTIEKMRGDVEADKSFIGGLSKNMHKHKREKAITGTGGAGKAVVMGILRRSDRKAGKSKVRAMVIPNTQAATLQPEVRATVQPGSRLFTDAWTSYRGLGKDYGHEVIDHAVEYVRDHVHTMKSKTFGAC